MTKGHITIKDIANEAGVSIGTVDRVLHNRGEVAEATRKKIESIAAQYNYKPNLMARALTTNRTFHIGILIPQASSTNNYWSSHYEGIRQKAFELETYAVKVSFFRFDINTAIDFVRASRELVEAKVNGAIVAPLFKKESEELASTLDLYNIPYLFIDTDLNNTNAIGFVGEDAYQSGRVAASVIDFGLPTTSDILMVNLAKDLDNAQHISSRNQGFLSYFMDFGRNNGVRMSVEITQVTFEAVSERLTSVLDNNKNIGAIWVSGGHTYLVAQFLEKNARRNIILVGHEVYEQNVVYLQRNYIQFLIAQQPKEQGIKALNSMFAFLTDGKQPIKQEYQKVEIVNSENVRFYI
ncbi:MAG: LacI family DNA-binding transcriptional regulator [Bacteroidales bacterium]|nr:LacI family DNA-binding transcriptional regulator [Bacteroidales bacterium]